MSQEQLKDIVTPHSHDVLSGRGNFVNHHAGNENFRALVKRHKKEYVACPKAQKPMYSILIYDEIRAMNPPGRFLKQDPATKLWSDIGKKKALDKTRQALREGAPEMLKEMGEGDNAAGGDNDSNNDEENQDHKKRGDNATRDNPLNASFMSNISIGSFSVEGMNDVPDSIQSVINQGHQAGGNSPGMNDVPDSIQSVINQGHQAGGNSPGMGSGGGGGGMMNHDNEPSRMLMAAQMQLIEQQMAQWQQLINLQNLLQNSGNQIDPNTQLQLLNLQLQLQNQQQRVGGNQQSQQQQNFNQNMNNMNMNNMNMNNMPSLPNFNNLSSPQGHQNLGGNFNSNSPNMDMPQMGNMGNHSPNPQPQLNDQNIAALLSAIHNNAANQNQNHQVPANPNSAFQQFQNQMAMQQLNQKINANVNQATGMQNTNSNNWAGNSNNNIDNILNAANAINGNNNNQPQSYGDFTVPLNDGSSGDQIVGMTMPLKTNERTPGNTSFARAQRIGLKNSFTRRANSHRQLNTDMANSLMSLDSLNLEDNNDDDEGDYQDDI